MAEMTVEEFQRLAKEQLAQQEAAKTAQSDLRKQIPQEASNLADLMGQDPLASPVAESTPQVTLPVTPQVPAPSTVNVQVPPQPSAPPTIPGLAAENRQNLEAAKARGQVATTLQQDANNQVTDEAAAEEHARLPVYHKQAEVARATAKLGELARQDIKMSAQQMYDDAITHRDNAAKIAIEKPHEFWDSADAFTKFRAIANIVIGVIPQVATLGMAPNAGLQMIDRFNQEQLLRQKQRYENEMALGKASDTMYGHLMDALKDQRLADTAYLSASDKAAEAALKELSSRYASPRLQAQAQKLNAEFQAKDLANQSVLEQTSWENSHKLITDQLTSLKMSLDQKQNESPLAGIVANIPKEVYKDVAKEAQGGRRIINLTNQLEQIMASGVDRDSIQQWIADSGLMTLAAVHFINPGKNIQGVENDMINAMRLGNANAFVDSLFKDPAHIGTRLRALREGVAGAVWDDVETVDPQARFDPNDPVWGNYIAQYLNNRAAIQANEMTKRTLQQRPLVK